MSNGASHARAGIGVYFGENDPDNVSEEIVTDKSETNNKAELTAILSALKICEQKHYVDTHHIVICSDSQYAMNCCQKWIKKWQKNDWKTAEGKPVSNKELI